MKHNCAIVKKKERGNKSRKIEKNWEKIKIKNEIQTKTLEHAHIRWLTKKHTKCFVSRVSHTDTLLWQY